MRNIFSYLVDIFKNMGNIFSGSSTPDYTSMYYQKIEAKITYTTSNPIRPTDIPTPIQEQHKDPDIIRLEGEGGPARD